MKRVNSQQVNPGIIKKIPISYFLFPISPQSGFTLIEVLVASGILVMVTGALLTVGRAAIRSQDLSLERSQAAALAQEAIEEVRQMRDTAFLDQGTSDFLHIFPDAAAGQVFHPIWDALSGRWKLVIGAEQIPDTSGAVQNFTRSVTVDPATELPAIQSVAGPVDGAVTANARRITVTVSWSVQGQTWSTTMTTLLTNWKPEA